MTTAQTASRRSVKAMTRKAMRQTKGGGTSTAAKTTTSSTSGTTYYQVKLTDCIISGY